MQPEAPMKQQQQPGKSEVQGEGNYDAARRHRKDVEEFVESGQVDEAAREAAPDSAGEAADMESAERKGKSHSKGEAPGDVAGSSGKQPPP
jgi:hypothetical protein